MEYREIVIMAISDKKNHYCVAGIDVRTGEWIRPVSDRPNIEGAIPRGFVESLQNPLCLLDTVIVPLIEHRPTRAQKENYLADLSKSWRKTGSKTIQQVINERGYDNPPFLFGDQQKEIAESKLTGESLLLLPFDCCEVHVKTFDRKKVSFNFRYRGNYYHYINVGDPNVRQQYIYRPDGTYPIMGNQTAVFSLTGRYQLTGKYYKMMAQLF